MSVSLLSDRKIAVPFIYIRKIYGNDTAHRSLIAHDYMNHSSLYSHSTDQATWIRIVIRILLDPSRNSHASTLYRSYTAAPENLCADIALAHAGVAARDVLSSEGVSEDTGDNHAGDDVVETVGGGTQQ